MLLSILIWYPVAFELFVHVTLPSVPTANFVTEFTVCLFITIVIVASFFAPVISSSAVTTILYVPAFVSFGNVIVLLALSIVAPVGAPLLIVYV